MRFALRMAVLGLVVPTAIVAACDSSLGARDSSLSAAVATVSTGPGIDEFLKAPSSGYVQAYLRFGPEMADDVIMAIDQEFMEGTAKPVFVSGGDWMAFIGIQRAGGLWVATGTPSTMAGTPSKERTWKIIDLQTRLQPNVWYRIRTDANFGTRHYKSFTIEGPGLNKTVDLSQYMLDYPNYAPFSAPTMTYYVAAMRSRGMMKVPGTPVAYYDDVQGGITRSDGTTQTIFSDSFETQPAVGAQPAITGRTINLASYQAAKWYLERDESIFTVQQVPWAHSGSSVGAADANLNN